MSIPLTPVHGVFLIQNLDSKLGSHQTGVSTVQSSGTHGNDSISVRGNFKIHYRQMTRA